MLIKRSPEVILSSPVPPSFGETPRQRYERTILKGRPLVVKLPVLAFGIKRPPILSRKTFKNTVDREISVPRDRRCDNCHHRHPSIVECGSNMLLRPPSFRPRRFNRELRVKSSGSQKPYT